MTRQLLFRREVFEARQDGWMGTAILVAPRTGWVVAGIGCLAMLAEGSPRYRLGSDDAVTDAAFMDSPHYGLWSRERASSGNDERFVTFV